MRPNKYIRSWISSSRYSICTPVHCNNGQVLNNMFPVSYAIINYHDIASYNVATFRGKKCHRIPILRLPIRVDGYGCASTAFFPDNRGSSSDTLPPVMNLHIIPVREDIDQGKWHAPIDRGSIPFAVVDLCPSTFIRHQVKNLREVNLPGTIRTGRYLQLLTGGMRPNINHSSFIGCPCDCVLYLIHHSYRQVLDPHFIGCRVPINFRLFSNHCGSRLNVKASIGEIGNPLTTI